MRLRRCSNDQDFALFNEALTFANLVENSHPSGSLTSFNIFFCRVALISSFHIFTSLRIKYLKN